MRAAARLMSSDAAADAVKGFKFEIFGRVQGAPAPRAPPAARRRSPYPAGVFFRKHTREFGVANGLRGWVMNTRSKTVVGEAVGSPAAVSSMKHWLRTTGSPASRISRAVFVDMDDAEARAAPYDSFTVSKGKQ